MGIKAFRVLDEGVNHGEHSNEDRSKIKQQMEGTVRESRQRFGGNHESDVQDEHYLGCLSRRS